MTKWIAIATTAALLPVLQARAQQPPSTQPRFDVASIKENKTNDGIISIQTQKGRFAARGFTLSALIRTAYEVQEFQVIGGPDWINTERFDVEATFAEADRPPVNLMLRALLAERFNLAVRNETRERPVFALVFARADKRPGPELQKSTIDCATAKGPGGCGSSVGPGYIQSRGRTMAQFAESLSRLTMTGSSLNRLIVDRTGAEGPYTLTLRFTPENIPPGLPPGLPPVDPNGPSIFTALQEQLGLKLEPANAMVPVLVVGSASRPTPN